MNTPDTIINPRERIVMITETCDDKQCDDITRSFYAIRDCELGYWRSTSDMSSPDAWTHSPRRRAEFRSYMAARREMEDIWAWRQIQAAAGHVPFVNIPGDGAAA